MHHARMLWTRAKMPPKQETFYTITAARASDLEHFFAGSIAVGAEGVRTRVRGSAWE